MPVSHVLVSGKTHTRHSSLANREGTSIHLATFNTKLTFIY